MRPRIRAGLAHLFISITLAAFVLLFVRQVLYPGPFYEAAGGQDLFLLIVSVDVVLGPLITFIVFKPGKPGLRFDLAVIATLQLAALAYGLHTIADARPVWVTFVKDRFELVRAIDIEPADLKAARPPFDRLSWTGPGYAGARIPSDTKERMKHMDLAILGGKDIHMFPRLYVPYEQVAGEAVRAAQPLTKLRALNPGRDDEIERLVRGTGRPADALVFLPMRAGKHDLSVLLDRESGQPLALSLLRPWEF